jgi:hypothetical protein
VWVGRRTCGGCDAQDCCRAAISLDGVVQPPSSSGWMLFNDEMWDVIAAGIAQSDAILLGRRTYLEFAELWPRLGSDVPMADYMNNTPKHIVSSTLDTLEWANSTLAQGRPRTGARQAQAAARQEHPHPRQPYTGAVPAARRAAGRAQPHGSPDRGRLGHASLRRDDRQVRLKLVDSKTLSTGVLCVTYQRLPSG